MEKLKLLVTCALVLVVGAAPVALGDWNPGDPYKMHYPQEPDPFGWDVCICCQAVADDFNCVAGGPIEDIHFWISWLYDELGVVGSWYIAIWDDVGSLPGSELWRWNGVGNLRIRHYGTGNQGWVCPYEPAWIVPDDHFNFYQVNITDINEPFVQTADTVYWLVIMAGKPAMFSDDGGATWSPVDTGIAASEQHDMAFVITSGEGVDWGDAPDYWPMGGGYPTLAGNNGANHGIRGPWLGDTTDAPDAEPDGQPDATATGDDLDADGDDEDGVSIPVLVQGQTDNITFEVNGGGGHVNIWINWNNDMDW
ncbi:MAG: DUF7901 domain-containing protein, partial [Planctomycetota bacterium]